MTEVAPPQTLVEMAQGYFRGKALCAAARLGIADELADGPRHVEQLASAIDANQNALYRLLRALAGIGVLAESSPEVFELTPLGQPLRQDHPESVHASMIFWADLLADFWTYLPECVRSSEGGGAMAAMERAGVASRWSLEPDPTAVFHAVFAEPGPEAMAPFAAAYDFSGRRVVADLGGAGGGLLVAILMAYPEIEGILVDRPEAVEHARERLTADGLLDRCRLVAADLMETVPEGADVYIMKAVLHGCVDDDARQILANCRAVMAPESRLLIIEVVLPERIERADPELEGSLMADLNMLVATGGQERRLSQWRRLLESAGFELLQVTPVASGNAGVIEARPVSARKTS